MKDSLNLSNLSDYNCSELDYYDNLNMPIEKYSNEWSYSKGEKLIGNFLNLNNSKKI